MSSLAKSSPANNAAKLAFAASLAVSCFFSGGAAAAIACVFTSAPGVAFGNYDDSLATPTDTTSTIQVRCDRTPGGGGGNSVTFTVNMGASANTGLESSRAMKNTASAVLLNYNLYTTIGRTTYWGSTAGNNVSATVSGIAQNGSQSTSLTIYGRIPALQNPTTGLYSELLAITVSP